MRIRELKILKELLAPFFVATKSIKQVECCNSEKKKIRFVATKKLKRNKKMQW